MNKSDVEAMTSKLHAGYVRRHAFSKFRPPTISRLAPGERKHPASLIRQWFFTNPRAVKLFPPGDAPALRRCWVTFSHTMGPRGHLPMTVHVREREGVLTTNLPPPLNAIDSDYKFHALIDHLQDGRYTADGVAVEF